MKQQDEAGRILVVDDDHAVRDVLRRYLERSGYQVDLAGDGETALRSFTAAAPDLVVLDLMLPGIGGLEVCRRIREDSPVPVVMLTALGEEADRVLGLELGADDYVVKPFSPRELVLRVGSVLRRSRAALTAAAESLRDGGLQIDVGARRCTLDGAALSLTGREFDLLVFLLRNPGRAFSRTELLEAVWGWSFGDHSTVTVHMRRLREKIEPDPARPRRISTVWGVGYRYDPAEPPTGATAWT
ncbi:response regulator transcription factor [Saccharopolyspora sp. WRP15-2]|uniref:Response regulator transcription factor n=1 Tax=Saccharopolyspora oryzae TaxID=2997343 RepID=A0ABT4V6L6_9PSEU|nr:response regulator transcription factor [Saccharopolyspora oryzae]MDA3629590.1 response regulator transcription factor [Saccharopolyspora oryzae]